ncbi:MAG: hypothetical protein U1E78_08860 [Gammaproteobacteria bacterium]
MRVLIFIVLNFFAVTSMACGPAMHAYLGQMWLDTHEVKDKIARRDFIIGTLFPDIRYMGHVSRSQTHEKHVTLERIDKENNFFKKGMLFHAYVDEQHEKFTNKSKAYVNLPKDIKSSREIFIELISDEIIFDEAWIKPLARDINTVINDEKILGLTELDLYPWHMLLNAYFMDPPSENLKRLNYLGRDLKFLKAKTVETWSKKLPEMKENAYYQKYTGDLINFFRAKIMTQVH